jgi:ornithine cyclodeaminase/alanine dehydrogenase-like protein (mu-crystallin family)
MISLSRSQLQDLVSIDAAAIAAIRDAYVAVVDGRANLPPVGYLKLAVQNADCHIKYGYIEGDPIFAVKIASGFYDNPKRGLPSSTGIVLVLSASTGAVLAILNDEGWLTDLRTAIGGAVATFALCRKDSETVAIIGTGTQARFQIKAAAALAKRPLGFSVWGRASEKAQALAAEFASSELSVTATPDLEQLCRSADIIVTTTPSKGPIVRSDWIRPGTHITAMGADAPGKQELESALVARADMLVTDLASQCLDHGEFAIPYASGLIAEGRCIELGAILNGSQQGRRSPGDITIADLTGVATQDIAIARTVLQRVHVR